MTPTNGRVLVVDDEELIRNLVVRHLTSRGLACEAASDGRHALALASTGAFDVVLSDIEMPGFDGLSLARDLLRAVPTVSVVLLSGRASLDHAIRAMRYGVADLMQKPFHLGSLDDAVDRALSRRRALREAEDYRRMLQKRIDELAGITPVAAAEAQEAHARGGDVPSDAVRVASELDAALSAVVDAIETRGHAPTGHGRRTRALVSAMIGARPVAPRIAHDIAWAALLHDVGIVSLPDRAIVRASERTNDAERLFRQHPIIGADMLRRVGTLAGAAMLVEAHHERWDGSGFPRGLKGEAIPYGAQLLAVADAADDFLIHDASRGPAELVEFLQLGVGTQFSPEAVEAFMSITAEDYIRVRTPEGDSVEECATTAIEVPAPAR